MINLIDQSGYLGVGFLMFLETIFPPIPSEAIMPLAGIAAARGKMDITGVIASGAAGAMLGNYFWYLAARVISIDRFKPLVERYGRYLTIDWDEVEKAKKLFGVQGWAIVLFGRMLPTIRSIVSIPAGLLQMRLSTFVIWSTIGTIAWTSFLALSGWFLGRRFHRIEEIIGPLSMAVIVAVVVAYLWRLWRWKPKPAASDLAD